MHVEEEFKHPRELIKTVLEQMDKRFNELMRHINRFASQVLTWRIEAQLIELVTGQRVRKGLV